MATVLSKTKDRGAREEYMASAVPALAIYAVCSEALSCHPL